MKKLYTGIIYAMAALAAVSCDDFLTRLPVYEYTEENAVTDYNSAVNCVNGIYGVFSGQSNLGGNIYGKLTCMAGLWAYDGTMTAMSYSQSNNGGTPSIWNGLYAIVNASNLAVSGIGKLDDSLFPSPAEKQRLIAEARCFRGYANLQLLWYFGRWFDADDSPYGIIYRDLPANLSNVMIGRSTVGDSYRYIIDDLKAAEEHLGDYGSARYLSRQFAQVMHAKLLLYRNRAGDCEEALALVNDVLATAPGAFRMESDIEELYDKGWDSGEVLFTRYIGDKTNMANYESMYSYNLYYINEFTELPQQWFEADARYPLVTGEARSPETWQNERKEGILTKLYRRGRIEGKDDRYTAYIFRYPELYLMKAELLMRTGAPIADAVAEINRMRAAYTNPVLEPLVGIATEEEFYDSLFREYFVTLALENESCWFASLRINHDGRPWIYTLKPDVNISEDKFCWPIPDDEIVSNMAGVKQNPGLQ